MLSWSLRARLAAKHSVSCLVLRLRAHSTPRRRFPSLLPFCRVEPCLRDKSQTFNRIGTPRFRLHMGRTTRRSLQYTQASPYHRASPTNHRLFIRTTRGTLRGLKHHRRWIYSFTARRKRTQETRKIWIAPHERTRSKIFAAQTGTLWIVPRTSSLPPLYHWSQGFSCRSGRQIHQGDDQQPGRPA